MYAEKNHDKKAKLQKIINKVYICGINGGEIGKAGQNGRRKKEQN